MSDEADSEDNVDTTHIDQVMHHKHPVVKLVREQIKNVEDPSIAGQDIINDDGTITTYGGEKVRVGGGGGGSGSDRGSGSGRGSYSRGEEGTHGRTSLGSRAWEKRGYCASSMMLLALVWLVLIYGAFIGANLCGSLSFKHKLCSGCGIGLGMVPGFSEAEQIYNRGVF